MADYSLHQSPQPAQHGFRHGWALTALAAVVLAALAWAWTQQQLVVSTLPQPVVVTVAPAPQTVAPLLPAAPSVTPPPSAAVAAAGDTRSLRP